MTLPIVVFLAIVASFVAGALYGRKAEAAAAAELAKVEADLKSKL